MPEYSEYAYRGADPTDAHQYLLPALRTLLGGAARLLDLGCGNGSLTAAVIPEGCEAHAVDLSPSGNRHASATCPGVAYHCLDVTGDLSASPGFGSFDVVISAEVVEHVYLPRNLAKNAYEA